MTTWDGDIASKQALDLSGSAYVSINDHDRYAFGTDDFTFEGWVNFGFGLEGIILLIHLCHKRM